MSNRPDLLGQRFGKLVVVENVRDSDDKPLWRCKCDCGQERYAITNYLLSGKIRHCGCENWKPTFNSAKTRLFASYKKTAKTKGIEFHLSEDDFFKLTQQSCFYCGVEPSNTMRSRTHEYIYNGLDRVDNTKGYSKENCVPCCSICNYAKRDMSVEQFKQWIKRIYITQYHKVTDLTPGQIIDQLVTVDIKCFMAQEDIMKYNDVDSEKSALAAVRAQELNDRRNKLVRSIDGVLDFLEDSPTEKTYHTYFDEKK